MLHEEMTSLEVRIRRVVLRRLLRGEPADLASLSTSTRLSPEEVAQALSKLNELGGIHVVEGALIAAYPLSGVPTRHRIQSDGAIMYANCAIDALAVPFMVDAIVRIESDCGHCGQAIMMQMSGERIHAAHPGSLVVFHVARECCEAGPAILTRCPHINFFCGTDHADRWRADNPGRLGDVLGLPQAIARARERFASTISLVRSEKGTHDAEASCGPAGGEVMEKTRFPPLSARREEGAMQQQGTRLEQLAGKIVDAMPTLGHDDQRVAVALYRLLAQGEPVSPTSLARAANLSETDIHDLLTRWPGVYHDDSGSVIGFWGLALTEMPHRFTVERRTLHTWCAWDSLFIPGIIGKTAHVESADPLTKALVTLSVGPDGVNDASSGSVAVSFLSPEGALDADVIMNFCHFVHFFDSEESGARWTATHKGTFLLSLEEAFTLGQMTNARKFQGVF